MKVGTLYGQIFLFNIGFFDENKKLVFNTWYNYFWWIFCYRKLGLDLVPRQGAQMVEPDSMSVVELYHVHLVSAENTQGVSVR